MPSALCLSAFKSLARGALTEGKHNYFWIIPETTSDLYFYHSSSKINKFNKNFSILASHNAN